MDLKGQGRLDVLRNSEYFQHPQMTSKNHIDIINHLRDDDTVDFLNAYEQIVARIPGLENEIKGCDLEDIGELQGIIGIVSPNQTMCIIELIPLSFDSWAIRRAKPEQMILQASSMPALCTCVKTPASM
jgi:hypothetical protein